MRERVEWTAAEAAPGRAEVLQLLGLPADTEPRSRTAALLDAAMAEYREISEPRAVLGDISAAAFADLYRGEGRNAPATPLEAIFPRAERLAIFTATLGAGITARVRGLFDRDQSALAVTLDAVASGAADRLADLLAVRLLTVADAGRDGWRVLAYSPGYCGWHLSGQRALFEFLRPEEIGVTLHPSCLMGPLKSVSGVLVAGPRRIHRFPPEYPFCADCADRPCRQRIASLSEET